MAVPQLSFLRSCVCCKDLGSNGLNNKHSLEEQVLHLASTTSSLAPVRWIKPVWLPRKAKVPLHGGLHRTGTISYQWTWNVKSTMRKDRPSEKQIKPASSWENGWLPTTSQLHCFALCNLYLGAFYSMVAGDCPTVVILVQPTYLDLHSLEQQLWQLASTMYNFNTRTSPMGKTSVASKMSTTTTAWWPASHWKTMPWNVKSTIRKAELPQHKPGSPLQNW